MKSAEIHALVDWPAILAQLGVPANALRNKHGPCPACGGKDRFRFDNRHRHGGFYCNQCGAGDGFKLLQIVHGWTFAEARAHVMEVAGLNGAVMPARRAAVVQAAAIKVAPIDMAAPTGRVMRLRRERSAIENCDDPVDYLTSRHLWPLPAGCPLWAHPTVEYWDDGRKLIGRYPALVADVVDIAGEMVALHVTWLHRGKKLTWHKSRKQWGKTTDRVGCAVRLMPAGAVLGIAEGIETALSAALLDGVPVWAATNAGLLEKFEPPPGVTTLRVYGDRDKRGYEATEKLVELLQGRVRLELRVPPPPAKDWNDFLINRNCRATGEGRSNE